MASRDSFLPPNDTGFDVAVSLPPISASTPSGSGASVPAAAKRRVDMRWSRVTMAQLEDDEFLQKQLHRLEIAASARHAGRGEALGQSKAPGASWDDLDQDRLIRDRIANARAKAARGVNSDQENEDNKSEMSEPQAAPCSTGDREGDEQKELELANALCIIAELDSSTRGALIQQRLTASLRQQCVFPNPVYKLIALRRKIMRHIQAAVAVQHQQRASAVAQWTLMVDAIRQVFFPSSSSSGNLTSRQAVSSPRGSADGDVLFTVRAKEASMREGSIGLHVLSWMLASLRGPKVTAIFQKKEFLHEILQLLSGMPRLALAPHRTEGFAPGAASGMGATRGLSEDSISRTLEIAGLVDSIHEFLLDVGPKPTLRGVSQVSPKVRAVASTSGELDIEDWTNAANALAHLAGATGSVRDFLILLKVLLGVPNISRESTASACPCSSSVRVSSSPGAAQVSIDPISEQDRCPAAPARDNIDIDIESELRAKLRSQEFNSGEFSGRKLRQEVLMYPDEIDTAIDGEKTSPSPPRKAGTKVFGYKANNLVAINPVSSATKSSVLDGCTSQRSRSNPASSSGSTTKSHERDEYGDVALPTGSLSVITDINAIRRESSARATGMASSCAETPLVTARCPKLKPLEVYPVIIQLDEAEPASYLQTSKSRTTSSSSGGSTWNLRDTDCADTREDGDEREVWSCGQNSYGELGHGDTTSRNSFERIESLQGKDIVLLGAGNEHKIALSGDGTVYTCGYNDNGQCG